MSVSGMSIVIGAGADAEGGLCGHLGALHSFGPSFVPSFTEQST